MNKEIVTDEILLELLNMYLEFENENV